MRRIYLIARREYLAFVTAWGFWVSLMILPLILSLSIFAPMMAERASPTRYYVVLADTPELDAAFRAGLSSGGRRAYEGAVRAASRMRGADAETERRAIEAYHSAPDGQAGLVAAAQELGLPSAGAFQLPVFRYQRIDPPPATDAEELRPYLLGQAMIETDEGPRGLHAAVFLRRAASGAVDVDYWSANLTDRTLLNVVEDAMRELMRREALEAAGVSLDAVSRANALEPRLVELNPEREVESAEVTLADRLPIFIGMAMGFVLWIVVFSVVNVLLTSVIEEKGGKILESLLASARYHEILMGKLVGVAGVSATLLAVWGGFAVFGLFVVGRSGAPLPTEALATVLDPRLLLPFAAYFVLGYLMFGSIFLAVGSLCETIQEAQTFMTPMIFVLMVPMLILPVIIRAPDSPIVQVLSWVPLYTPFVMMIRLPSGPPLYEIVGTSVVLFGATMLILWAAGGVFRAGVIGRAGPDSLKKLIGRLFRRPQGSKNSGGDEGAGAVTAP
jgi:ABC-2 type transport system permease protein